jgi:hypothetical protein
MYFLNQDGTLDKTNYIENYVQRHNKYCMCSGCCYNKCKKNKLLQFVFVIIILYILYKLYLKYKDTLKIYL